MNIELATLQMEIEFKNGEPTAGTPRLDIVQDNMDEVAKHVPDGRYRWTLSLNLDTATKVDPL